MHAQMWLAAHGLSGMHPGESHAWVRCAHQVQDRLLVLLHMLDTEQPAQTKQLNGCPWLLLINSCICHAREAAIFVSGMIGAICIVPWRVLT